MTTRDSWFTRLLNAVLAAQLKRPGIFLLTALLLSLPAAFLATSLPLKSSFHELLPDGKPSVVELRRTNDRLASSSSLTIALEGTDTAVLRDLVDALVPKLRGLPPDLVASVDPGPKDAQEFFEKYQALYAPLDEIQDVHDKVVERWDWEVGKETGSNLGLDDEAPPAIDGGAIRKRFEDGKEKVRSSSPGKDGYYIGEDGHLAAILLRTALPAMDQRAILLRDRLSAMVDETIATGKFKERDASLRYAFGGSLMTSAEGYHAVSQDLVTIGVTGVGMVLLVVFLFFLRFRVLVALGIALTLGVTWALAFAKLSVGHLNMATGFLVSIIAGNGMNGMIIWMSRYLEARRDEGLDVEASTRRSTRDTAKATLSVVGVAMISFGALIITDFRGFRHFGIIGGMGMFMCWLSTYLVLPTVMVLIERLRPLSTERTWRERLAGSYGKPFLWLARRHYKIVSITGVVFAVVGVAATTRYFMGDPMEYNLRNVINDEKAPTSTGKITGRVNALVGRINQSGRAVVVDRLDQVEPLVTELERRRDAAPAGAKPFEKVVSIYSLLPKEQEEKLELLQVIRDRLERAHEKKIVSEEDWAKFDKLVPADLSTIGIDRLPASLTRAFQEKSGEIGKIVFVAPTNGRSLNDAHYLKLWASSFRTIQLPNGEIIHGSGDAVVYSDMLDAVTEHAPWVLLASTVGTGIVILISFRFRRSGIIAMSTLYLGIAWLIGTLSLLGIKLNFLNFVAIPVAIGAGADYAINVMSRRDLEGPNSLDRVFIETGGAVVACSLTTLSGYCALLMSVNGAVRSFGIAAAIGEVATQLAAMLVLPALLTWWDTRQAAKAKMAA